MADRPVPELGHRTPLEAAQTPNLDALAREGVSGLLDVISPGVRPGSDTGHLSLLGYDPFTTYTGRGPLEAAGVGLEVRGGDVCFRCNFSTVDAAGIITDRRAGRIREGTDKLAAAINTIGPIDGVECIFKESVEHRGALILRGEGLSADLVDHIDPHETGLPVGRSAALKPGDQAAERTAKVLNEFVRRSQEVLRDHPLNKQREAHGELPANVILPRGPGMAPHLKRFTDKYGIPGACVVEVGLLDGLGRYLGLDIVEVPGATGSLDTDVDAIGRAVLQTLNTHEFVLCNVKGPDIAGHNGDAPAKVTMIERIDGMVGDICKGIAEGVVLAVTADHSTPVVVMDHSGDPTPLLLWGPGVRPDGVGAFGERPASTGGLLRLRGIDLMPVLMDLMNRTEKFGA